MIPLSQLVEKTPLIENWLIIGKGPTAAKVNELKLPEGICRMTLNHAINTTWAHLAHFIDLEAVKECNESLRLNARAVIVPTWMNQARHRAPLPTVDYVDSVAQLAHLSALKKLVVYDRDSFKRPIQFFSSEAAFQIAGEHGAKKVYSIGIDGKEMADNGRNYDEQFEPLGQISKAYGFEWERLVG